MKTMTRTTSATKDAPTPKPICASSGKVSWLSVSYCTRPRRKFRFPICTWSESRCCDAAPQCSNKKQRHTASAEQAEVAHSSLVRLHPMAQLLNPAVLLVPGTVWQLRVELRIKAAPCHHFCLSLTSRPTHSFHHYLLACAPTNDMISCWFPTVNSGSKSVPSRFVRCRGAGCSEGGSQ